MARGKKKVGSEKYSTQTNKQSACNTMHEAHHYTTTTNGTLHNKRLNKKINR